MNSQLYQNTFFTFVQFQIHVFFINQPGYNEFQL